jgi:hypothetical protein
MLRTFSAALIATAIIASPAFAASSTGTDASTPAATTTAAPVNSATAPSGKPVKTVKHQHKPLVRHHVIAKNKRHVKLSAKPHRQHIVLHSRKPTKTVKTDKTHNSKTHETRKVTKPTATHG